MTRTFAYARVSKIEQEPENQIKEIVAAGFVIEPHRIITETISGSVPRRAFKTGGTISFCRSAWRLSKNITT